MKEIDLEKHPEAVEVIRIKNRKGLRFNVQFFSSLLYSLSVLA
jgi:hypothetical protein